MQIPLPGVYFMDATVPTLLGQISTSTGSPPQTPQAPQAEQIIAQIGKQIDDMQQTLNMKTSNMDDVLQGLVHAMEQRSKTDRALSTAIICFSCQPWGQIPEHTLTGNKIVVCNWSR